MMMFTLQHLKYPQIKAVELAFDMLAIPS